MKIQIDFREKNRIKKAKEYYHNHSIIVEDLPVGDFIFNEQVVFEYKTFQDFISSVIDKRVFNQAINQMNNFPHHYIIIQRGRQKLKSLIDKFNYSTPVHFTEAQYYGAIARLNTYTTVIPVAGGMQDCFKIMRAQAKKSMDNKPIVKINNNKTDNPAINFLCTSVSKINTVRAEQITNELDLYSLNDLLQLNKEDLTNINGIGEKTATIILKQLGAEQ